MNNDNVVGQWMRGLLGDRTGKGRLGEWNGYQRAGSLK